MSPRVGSYREFAPPTVLTSMVACLWENHGIREHEHRVIPDGCVDLVWLNGELVISGADTGPMIFAATNQSEPVSGIRLRPGSAGAVLGLSASAVSDARVPVTAVWPEVAMRLTEALTLACPRDRLGLLACTVLQRKGEPDDLVAAAARRLAAPSARIGAVAADLGVSERHLHRRSVAAIGYGPKMLGRVVRLRRLIALSTRPMPMPLAQCAAVAGYAGQSHMSDDVRKLTGLTAVRFLEDAVLTAA